MSKDTNGWVTKLLFGGIITLVVSGFLAYINISEKKLLALEERIASNSQDIGMLQASVDINILYIREKLDEIKQDIKALKTR